ncbi:MAG: helix-turn-helix domain containing protein [Candidatus Pacebacteria bacterium]|nr:helix-turn-helix domain containing protein [Candidatus Paceibacterota bacterium]
MPKREKKLNEIISKVKTVTVVAEELKVSRKTVYKWLKAYEKNGSDIFKNPKRRTNKIPGVKDVSDQSTSRSISDNAIFNTQKVVDDSLGSHVKIDSDANVETFEEIKIREVIPNVENNNVENVNDNLVVEPLHNKNKTVSNLSNYFNTKFSKLSQTPVLLSILAVAASSLLLTSNILPSKSETLKNVASYSLLNESTLAQSNPEAKSLLSTISIKVYCGISYFLTSESEWKCGKNSSINLYSNNTKATTTPTEIIKYITQVSTTTVYVNGTTTPVINNITRYIPVPGPKGDAGPQGIQGPKGDIGLTGSSGSYTSGGTLAFTGPTPQYIAPTIDLNNKTFLSPTLSNAVLNGVSTFNGLLSATDITANTLVVSATTTLATTTVNGSITFTKNIIDSLGLSGTSGQVLSSTGTSTRWVAQTGGGGGGAIASGTVQYSTLFWDGSDWL